MADYDAIVVGSGPNGMAAAVEVARAGWKVLVLEAEATLGGGSRTEELTLPGFKHDTCSAVHPMGIASPFFRELPLHEHGLEWIHPDAQIAHPLDDGSAGVLERSLDATAHGLGVDGDRYRRLIGPLASRWGLLETSLMAPLVRPPRHPVAMAHFGVRALWPARALARRVFRTEQARGLFAGTAAHAFLPLTAPLTASYGVLMLALGHVGGWPVAKGGSQSLIDALASYLRSLGGETRTNERVASLDQLPSARAVFLDTTPRFVLDVAGDRLHPRYRRSLEKYKYGPGSFKVDWALDGPVPWKADACRRSGTVHLGGTLEEIAASEQEMLSGRVSDKPYVLIGQQSLADPTRAPEGKHTLWAYCHVPNGSTVDMTDAIERQIERFAPGFRELVIGRSVRPPAELERHNANYVGGDIVGGSSAGLQFAARPILSPSPYAVRGLDNVYLCSASTAPGGGVHGMCGYWAAQAALKQHR
ncbi:MAG: NAD(P)/FAD-dependent oxidoreductase [Actinobacteria bacterium]|nr:NAD(P)/FAD-dependent oxidoreductase [Actinomycetota bacterium]